VRPGAPGFPCPRPGIVPATWDRVRDVVAWPSGGPLGRLRCAVELQRRPPRLPAGCDIFFDFLSVSGPHSSDGWQRRLLLGGPRYHDVSVADSVLHDAAWSYPHPYPSSFDRVGQDYSGYVAFDKRQVTVSE
jgi:hypothetical protein